MDKSIKGSPFLTSLCFKISATIVEHNMVNNKAVIAKLSITNFLKLRGGKINLFKRKN